MDSIMIWLSIGMFVLLPFYLWVFTLDKRRLQRHIVLWLCLHLFGSLVFWFLEKDIWNTPLLLLCGYALYYLCTYVFYVRDMYSKQEADNLRNILASKWFSVVFAVLTGFATLVLLADEYLLIHNMIYKKPFEFGYLYLAGIVLFSYIQIIYWGRKYYHKRGGICY